MKLVSQTLKLQGQISELMTERTIIEDEVSLPRFTTVDEVANYQPEQKKEVVSTHAFRHIYI